MGFTDSFNSSLRAATMIQGIYLRGEDRRLKKQERRANEFSRGLDQFEKQYGSDNPADWGPEGQAALTAFLNEYPENMRRPMGSARVTQIVPAGGGVAAEVEVDDGEGNVSRGPITKRGTSDDDDEVVTITSTSALKEPVWANYEQAKFNARVKSEKVNQRHEVADNIRNTENAFETLNSRFERQAAGGQPAAAVPEPPPVNEQILEPESTVTPEDGSAQTAPATGIPSFEGAAPAAGGVGTFTPRTDTPFKTPGAVGAIRSEAEAIGLDPELAMATSYHESAFGDTNARSHTGAQGLFQIVDAGATEDVNKAYGTNYTVEQAKNDEATNIAVGTRYLKLKLDEFDGDREKALMAYNSGAGAVRRADAGGEPVRQEGLDYPGKVLQYLTGSGDAVAAEPEAPSAEAPALSAEAPAPSAELEGIRPQAGSGRRSRKGRREQAAADTQADRDSVTALKAALRAAPNRKARRDLMANVAASDRATAAQAELEVFEPTDDAEATIVEEAKSVSAEPTPQEEQAAAEVVTKTKPAVKWTEEERKALYTLHRVNPAQFPIASVVAALKTGRMTKESWTNWTNEAGQHLQTEQTTGETRVLQDTPEGKAAVQAKLGAAQAKATAAAAKSVQDYQTGQLNQTEAQYALIDDLGATLTLEDPEKVQMHRNKTITTADTMGLNLNDRGTPVAINKAAHIQEKFNEDNGPRWYAPFRDQTHQDDYGFGMGVMNAPDNPYNENISDDDGIFSDDSMTKSGNWYHDKYLKPMIKAYPGMSPTKQTQAGYVATHLVKSGMTRDDAIKAAGAYSTHAKFRNATPADIIKALNTQIAKQGR